MEWGRWGPRVPGEAPARSLSTAPHTTLGHKLSSSRRLMLLSAPSPKDSPAHRAMHRLSPDDMHRL